MNRWYPILHIRHIVILNRLIFIMKETGWPVLTQNVLYGIIRMERYICIHAQFSLQNWLQSAVPEYMVVLLIQMEAIVIQQGTQCIFILMKEPGRM